QVSGDTPDDAHIALDHAAGRANMTVHHHRVAGDRTAWEDYDIAVQHEGVTGDLAFDYQVAACNGNRAGQCAGSDFLIPELECCCVGNRHTAEDRVQECDLSLEAAVEYGRLGRRVSHLRV